MLLWQQMNSFYDIKFYYLFCVEMLYTLFAAAM